MSDSLKNDLVESSFVAGEQPTHIKLSGVVSQLNTAVNRLSLAVGDLYTQQTQIAGSGAYDIDSLSNVGPNISRLIGSAGWLNPRNFSREDQTLTVVFAGHTSAFASPPEINGFTHYNRREFKLPFPPVLLSGTEGAENLSIAYSYALGSPYWIIGAPGGSYTDVSGSKVTTRVSDLASLNASGEYHVSKDGVITLFDALDNPGTAEGFSVTYVFNAIPDSYDGASLNVIPDFSQTTTLCTVSLVSGSTYQIVLPLYTGRRGWGILSSWSPYDDYVSFADTTSLKASNLDDQLRLPFILRQNLSSGDVIPAGYIYLWDEVNGTIVEGIEFTYVDTDTVNATGITLTASTDRYRLIVPGTNIGRTISHLRESYYNHDHSGRFINPEGAHMGNRIRHYDLLNLIDEGDGGSDSDGFVVSSIGPSRHPHPQYLHRYGYQYANSLADPGNVENALLGSLVIGNIDGTLDTTADSWSLYFAGYGASSGGRMKYDQGNDRMEFSIKDVLIDRVCYIGEGYQSSSAEAATPRINMTAPAGAVSRYQCSLAVEASGEDTTRLYLTPNRSASFAGGGALVATTNAGYDGTTSSSNWVRDSASADAGRLDFSNGSLDLYAYDASAPSGDTFLDSEWLDGTNGVNSHSFSYSFTTGSRYNISDGIIAVQDATTNTNPAKTTNTVKNALYAKNIAKAWGHVTVTTGTPVLDDGFGVSGVSVVGNDVKIDFYDSMSNRYFAAVATFEGGDSPILLNTINDTSSTYDFFYVSGWDVQAAGHFDWASASGAFSFVVFGEQA